ncbi:hypothetical protein Cob_v007096 [Colletotrichum orbiculare MAFF 240422]|uniref:Uncharacterized protein n=1 Tax=Colletotrichum orbiculare (strain 104-T / ATCC 96160 / CBS 514.97 / LARS 414 / MAFF 240422) TaxID=1213857 RepID=A0A484FQ35_COLOR|nr:hypothetical protein Cob_v007096 [Colletotrichum orbiculare MAFF 240422]
MTPDGLLSTASSWTGSPSLQSICDIKEGPRRCLILPPDSYLTTHRRDSIAITCACVATSVATLKRDRVSPDSVRRTCNYRQGALGCVRTIAETTIFGPACAYFSSTHVAFVGTQCHVFRPFPSILSRRILV